MKKIIASLAIVASTMNVLAQSDPGSFFVQPKVGLNVANFMDAEPSSPRLGFVGCVELELFATEMWSMSFGALYSMQGARYNEYQYFDGKLKMKVKADYIKIPILANFYVVKGLAFKMGFSWQ